jgi:hypothetical protein
MVHIIQANGFWVFARVTEFIRPKQVKNIVVNGKMMYAMAKVSGLKKMDQ